MTKIYAYQVYELAKLTVNFTREQLLSLRHEDLEKEIQRLSTKWNNKTLEEKIMFKIPSGIDLLRKILCERLGY